MELEQVLDVIHKERRRRHILRLVFMTICGMIGLALFSVMAALLLRATLSAARGSINSTFSDLSLVLPFAAIVGLMCGLPMLMIQLPALIYKPLLKCAVLIYPIAAAAIVGHIVLMYQSQGNLIYTAATAFVVVSAMSIICHWFMEDHARLVNKWLCPKCEYDLHGRSDSSCPECGWGR